MPTIDERLAAIEELLALLAPPPVVAPLALPGTVAPGELIESSWGNAVQASIGKLYNNLTHAVLWGYTVQSTNGTGDTAVPIGGVVDAAFAISTQGGSVGPMWLALREPPSGGQVVFRCYNGSGAPVVNAQIGFMFAIFQRITAP
jgi:hypothetical protein